MNNIMSYLIDIGCLKPTIHETYSVNPQPKADDYASLIKQYAEARILNTQARIEYGALKMRILAEISELNKFLELDDQINVQEYKLCTSLSYRQQFFIMELKQLDIDNDQCNHALDLVFQGSDKQSDGSGRTTLVLVRERNQFAWHQLRFVAGGPAGTSKLIASLVLRWFQNKSGLFMRFSPV